LDTEGIEQLLPATQGLPLVFHMAFDLIPMEQQKTAMDKLIDYGFVRILLHGSAQRHDIFENVTHIKELVDYADHRIEI
ncbi:copper homeostasis protein CutC, partial [Streptococcus pyogenes]